MISFSISNCLASSVTCGGVSAICLFLAVDIRIATTAVTTPASEPRIMAISCIYVYHLIQEYFLRLASGNPQLAHLWWRLCREFLPHLLHLMCTFFFVNPPIEVVPLTIHTTYFCVGGGDIMTTLSPLTTMVPKLTGSPSAGMSSE